jgi:aminoglycoside 6'-N-acetyltransferase
MRGSDLDLVRAWLGQPHIAEWYLSASTIDEELADLHQSLGVGQPTQALVALEGDRPIGWCQWYLCGEYPEHASGVDAAPGDIGIDYAIGEPSVVGRGVGTELIAALVNHARLRYPGAGIIADPEVGNWASRRVLEKNGFRLVAERVVASEPSGGPMAIYRLPAPTESAIAIDLG